MNKLFTKYLMAVVEFGSISKAARELFISQPYLSKYIKTVEQELGVELINRNVSPITLTYAGEIYVSYMGKINDLYVNMKHEMERISNLEKGRLIIGTNPVLASYNLYYILPSFIEKYPGIEVVLIEDTADVLDSKLIQNKIDICLNMLPITNEDILYEKLYDENIFLVVPKGHHLYNEENIPGMHIPFDYKSLDGEKFILLKQGLGLRRLTDELFSQYNIKPNIFLETQNIENGFRIANSCNALTIIPECIIANDDIKVNANLYTIGEPIYKNHIVITYKKNSLLSPSAQAFLDLSKNIFK